MPSMLWGAVFILRDGDPFARYVDRLGPCLRTPSRSIRNWSTTDRHYSPFRLSPSWYATPSLWHFSVDLTFVQAYFTEAVSCPCLEYMLLANATRLAYSKGLHRRPILAWRLNPSEEFHRTRLFWAIYTLEKNCCSWSGRPSVCRCPFESFTLPLTQPVVYERS